MKSVVSSSSLNRSLTSNLPLWVVAVILALLLLILSGCKTIETPVPVYGTSEDVIQLLGEWYGEYSSPETNRHGVIYFKLDVEADSAVGQVIMKQGKWDDKYFENESFNQSSEMLTIRFVQVGPDRVVGRLDDYRDPACGCLLHTLFDGHLNDDRIEGVYVSHGDGFHMTTSGKWWADRRSRPPVSVSK